MIRASQDADVVLSLAIRDAARLKDVFALAGFTVELRRGDHDDPIQAVIELGDTFGNRVDLLVGLRGLSTETFSRSINVQFSGGMLRVVSSEDFIAVKAFAGGHRITTPGR